MELRSVMVWLMVLAAVASTASAAVLTVGPGQTYSTVQAAVNAASDGDTIEIYSATYTGSEGNTAVNKSNLTLTGVGATRPILDAGGTSIDDKAIWVVSGSNTTVEFIEFRNCSVSSKNGAGIRQEGDNLTVRDCYFHDNENGILGGGSTSSDVLVEYSEFYNNGYGDGFSHNMYIGNVSSFTLRHSWSHHAYVGHEVKTRAQVNYIECNRLTNEDGNASYEVHIPNGGTSYVIGNLIHQGSDVSNGGIIAYADEGATNPDQHLYVVSNTIVNDRSSCTFVRNASTTDCLLQNNIFQGSGTVLDGPGTQVTNWVTINASLADPGNYDYHLTAGSTGAIDQGGDPGIGMGYSLTPVYQYVHPIDRETRPSDATLDIGCYEYGGTVLPNVQFDQMASSGQESVTPVLLTVSLSTSSGDTVTVDYSVTGGTATGGGGDYTLAAGTLIFDPGVTAQDISMDVVDDSEEEINETVEVTLSNPSHAVLGPQAVHTYTIVDNDGSGMIVLQDGVDGYSGTADNYITAAGPDTNYGLNERMSITGYEDLGPEMQRGLVRFDLSSVSPGTPVIGATLSLYSYDEAAVRGTTGYYGAYRVTTSWGDASSTWNTPWTTPGGDYEATPDATSPKQATALVWYDFDATSRVQQWISDPSGNFGWIIKCTDEMLHNQDYCYQSDTTNSQYRPKLVIYTRRTVQFDATSSSGDEPVTPVNLSVSLSPSTTDTVTVDYSVTGGTAAGGGVDYTLAAGTLIFDPGVTSQNIPIDIVDDLAEEYDETIEVTLSNPTNADLGPNTVHTYTIVDDEGVVDDVADGETTVNGTVIGSYVDTQASDDVYESITEVRVGNKVKGYSALEHEWTINVTGGDYVTFHVEAYQTASVDGDNFLFQYYDGQDWVTMVTVTKTSDDDTAQSFAMPSSTSGSTSIRVIDTDHSQGNQDMDTLHVDHMFIRSRGDAFPPAVQFDLTSSSGDESVTPALLAVSLDRSSSDTVTVDYDVSGGTATGGGVDYTLAAGTLIFDPGVTSQNVSIDVVDDGELESDETVEVTLSNPSNAMLGSNTVHTYTILDNEVPPPSVQFDETASSGDESVTPALLTVSLSSSSSDTVTVDYDVTGGTATGGVDYTLAAGTLTFDPGVTSQDVPISIVDDSEEESDETIEVTLSNPSNATLGSNTVHTYTILDNEGPPPSVQFEQTASSGDEDVTPALLAVSLSSSSSDTVTVDYDVTGGTATGGGVDYTLAAGTLIFDPGVTSQDIPISIVDDAEQEPDETIEVTLNNPSNATLGGNTVHTYTINANDGSLPGQATDPYPPHNVMKIPLDADLSWTPGAGATSHNLYFGTTNPPPFVGNLSEPFFDPGVMPNNVWHYWRVDEVNEYGTTTGVDWRFKTNPN
ncbi:MAG TPA: Calx-beta domain-containing protein [Phycisphaerae bacterium]|nr:Calx-beta domain-containing protein [Phycisphaerae bacterium]